MISFDVTNYERKLINQIVKRAAGIASEQGYTLDRLSLTMDITATHANGCPLKLSEILEADDFNFVHDVFGIRRHIDRRTGKLGNCFLPRMHAPLAGAKRAS